jgi:membrane associated rhomboid family serine protease
MFTNAEGGQNRRAPAVTLALIFVNLAVYVLQVLFGGALVDGFAMVPKEVASGRPLAGHQAPFPGQQSGLFGAGADKAVRAARHAAGPAGVYLTLLTYQFLHANLRHLIGNLWVLWTFGFASEQELGHRAFALLYLAAGVAAGLAQTAAMPAATVPCVGASGAIAGVMAAYLFAHPLGKVRFWIGPFLGSFELPALVMLGIWAGLQYWSGVVTQAAAAAGRGGVAYWAHVGGFGAGLALAAIFAVLRGRRGPEAAEPPAYREAPVGALLPTREFRTAREWGGR